MNRHENDTAYLQRLIDAADTPVIPKENPLSGDDVWVIEKPLLLDSNKHILLDGAHLRLADGVYANIFTTEYPLFSGSAVKTGIEIRGIHGAVLDGGVYNGLSERNMGKDGLPHILNNTMIYMANVDGFAVDGIRIVEQRYWGMTFRFCRNGRITNIAFQASNQARNQDGIDLRYGCHDILIDTVTGTTGDDTVALTALSHRVDNCSDETRSRDIHHVTIRNVEAACTGGHGIIRLLCHDGLRVHDIAIENVADNGGEIGIRNFAAIRIGDPNYSSVKPAEDTDMYNIRIDGVRTNAPIAIKLHGRPENFSYTDIHVTDGQVLVNTKYPQ